jgi:hypothetical protein
MKYLRLSLLTVQYVSSFQYDSEITNLLYKLVMPNDRQMRIVLEKCHGNYSHGADALAQRAITWGIGFESKLHASRFPYLAEVT